MESDAQESQSRQTHASADETSPIARSQDFELGSAQVNVTERLDVPLDGGYGWMCSICVFLINAHTWGVNSAWGGFLAHFLTNSTFPNSTQLQYALIGGLSISQALVVSPLVAHPITSSVHG